MAARHALSAFVLTAEKPKTPVEIKEHFANDSGITVVTYQSLHKLRRYFNKLSLALFDESDAMQDDVITDYSLGFVAYQ
jgi:hypothetical protein